MSIPVFHLGVKITSSGSVLFFLLLFFFSAALSKFSRFILIWLTGNILLRLGVFQFPLSNSILKSLLNVVIMQ